MNKSKQAINRISIYALKVMSTLFYIIPMPVLYRFSPILKSFLESVANYRKKTIKRNLVNSLRVESIEHINRIVSDYYTHLSEIIVENLKLFSASSASSMSFTVINPEILDPFFQSGTNVLLLTGHLGNWELGFSLAQTNFKHEVIGIYKQQSNEEFDQYLLKLREKRGVKLLREEKFVKSLLSASKTPQLYMLIPDQYPKSDKNVMQLPFLNQSTPFSGSIERIAKKYHIPVLYADIVKTKRGQYTTSLLWIAKSEDDIKNVEITKQYCSLLERNILSNPSIWLWSHKRWK